MSGPKETPVSQIPKGSAFVQKRGSLLSSSFTIGLLKAYRQHFSETREKGLCQPERTTSLPGMHLQLHIKAQAGLLALSVPVHAPHAFHRPRQPPGPSHLPNSSSAVPAPRSQDSALQAPISVCVTARLPTPPPLSSFLFLSLLSKLSLAMPALLLFSLLWALPDAPGCPSSYPR